MNTLLKKFNYFFASLIRNRETSPELSKIINQYLDDPETDILILNKYCCVLEHPTYNRLCLWIANYPYCYGYVACDHSNLTVKDWENYKKLNFILGEKLPDRKTVYRLNEVVENKKRELGFQNGQIEQQLKEILNV
jgi:hypothetical protein